MPLHGRFTPRERIFIQQMARTGDATYSATKAGYKSVAQSVHHIMKQPAIRAEIAEEASRTLFEDLLPLALAAHKTLLTDKATPAGARVQAIKLTYDRTLGSLEAGDSDKELSEMTADELRKALARVTSELDQRPAAAKDITPILAPGAGVFD